MRKCMMYITWKKIGNQVFYKWKIKSSWLHQRSDVYPKIKQFNTFFLEGKGFKVLC